MNTISRRLTCRLESLAMARLDAFTAGRFANGYAILSQTHLAVAAPLNMVLGGWARQLRPLPYICVKQNVLPSNTSACTGVLVQSLISYRFRIVLVREELILLLPSSAAVLSICNLHVIRQARGVIRLFAALSGFVFGNKLRLGPKHVWILRVLTYENVHVNASAFHLLATAANSTLPLFDDPTIGCSNIPLRGPLQSSRQTFQELFNGNSLSQLMLMQGSDLLHASSSAQPACLPIWRIQA